MQTPVFVAEVLKDYDTNPRPVAEYQIASALIAALQKHKPLSVQDDDGFRADLWAFTMHVSEEGEKSCWGTHFGSRSADGPLPDMKQNGAPLIEHWQRRADEVKHPVLRARYADLVWDLKRLATGRRADIKFARLAVDSYLEAVVLQLYQHAVGGIDYAKRALNLSLGINDKERIKNSRDAMFRLYDGVAVPSQAGTWPFLFDSLYANRKVELTKVQANKLVSSLEDILSACVKGGENVNLFAGDGAARRLERHYNHIRRPREIRRVVRVFGEAIKNFSGGSHATQAIPWLQAHIKKCHDMGMTRDAERANRLLGGVIGKARQEMKEVSVRMPIAADKLAKYLNDLTSGGLAAAIRKIAIHFIPRIDAARKFLRRSEKNFPLSSMFNVVILRETGIVAGAGSISGDPDGRLMIQITDFIDGATYFLAKAIDRSLEVYSPTPEDIADALYHSPPFDPDRRGLIHSGLDAYLRCDLVKAVHVLLPQIEHILLRLGEHLGVVTRKPSRRHPSAVQWINLYDTLQEKKVQKCLGTDLTLYLRILLVDPSGHNVRNHVCHGHLNPEHFTRVLADRVLHVLFALSLVINQKRAPTKPRKL